MSFFPVKSLRTKLILAILASLIPALGVDFYYARNDFHKAELTTRADATSLTRLVKTHHQQALEDSRHLMTAVGNLPAIRDGSGNCRRLLLQLLHGYPDYVNFGVADAQGKVLCTAAPPTPAHVPPPAFFKHLASVHTFIAGPYQVNPENKAPVILLGLPLYAPDGRLSRLFFAERDLSISSRLQAYSDFLKNATLTIFDNQGQVLDRYPDAKTWIGRRFGNTQLMKTILARQGEGVARLPDLDGESRLYAFTRIEDIPSQQVFLAVGIPLQSAYALPKRILYGDLTSAGIAGILIILISWIVIDDLILRHISALLHTTNRIRHGDLSARSQLRPKSDEIGELASGIDDMAAALEEKVSGQRDTEQSLLQLAKMSELLQVSSNIEEASGIAARFARRLFADGTGALFTLQPGAGLFEPLAVWGALPEQDQFFAPDDCWAVRRGKPYMWDATENAGPRCHHVSDPQVSYLCFPIIAQGQIIGIIHLRSGLQISQLQSQYGHGIVQLAETFAEQTGLALANLKLRLELQDQATRDPLTGLYNRRYMEEALAREIQRANRRQSAVSVLMIDIDFFKKINDTYGHEAGDSVLKAVAAAIQRQIRVSDVACRYGGEEFLVILPETRQDEAIHRAEEIREAVRQLQFSLEGPKLGTVTVSLGVASFPAQGQTLQAIVQAADSALYQAKQSGRDQVQPAAS